MLSQQSLSQAALITTAGARAECGGTARRAAGADGQY
jgi:hypothetical protein